MSGRRTRAGASLIAALAVFVGGGCATYSERIRDVERYIAMHQPRLALAALKKSGRARTDRVLYDLNEGVLLRMLGEYVKSNAAFERAERRIEKFRALSFREQATSLLINDAARTYIGAEYEQVLLHVYKALNYIDQGDLDAARVEALQVDIKLRVLAGRSDQTVFTEEALSRYLTGMIYEELGEQSDALIAYRKAYEGYVHYREKYGVAVPESLKYALLRLAEYQGLSEEETAHVLECPKGTVKSRMHNALSRLAAYVKEEES